MTKYEHKNNQHEALYKILFFEFVNIAIITTVIIRRRHHDLYCRLIFHLIYFFSLASHLLLVACDLIFEFQR